MALRPKYKNEVTLTMRISNDFGERKAIYKVSDKLVRIAAYKNCGHDDNGVKNPPINAEIMVFIGDAKQLTETDFSSEHYPKPGDFIDVTGSISTSKYVDKSGNERSSFKINASKVVFSEMESYEEDSHEEDANIWGR